MEISCVCTVVVIVNSYGTKLSSWNLRRICTVHQSMYLKILWCQFWGCVCEHFCDTREEIRIATFNNIKLGELFIKQGVDRSKINCALD